MSSTSPTQKFQFRIDHLFLSTTLFAVLTLLCKHNPWFCFMAIPVGVGPLAGAMVSRSLLGAFLGLVSASFWTIFLGGFAILWLTTLDEVSWIPSGYLPNGLFVLFLIIISTVGGIAGGKIAQR